MLLEKGERMNYEKDSQMLGRISAMIPIEFYQTKEKTTEQAVALLLCRYYDMMAEAMYKQAERLEVQP